jgi:hypothetical protein
MEPSSLGLSVMLRWFANECTWSADAFFLGDRLAARDTDSVSFTMIQHPLCAFDKTIEHPTCSTELLSPYKTRRCTSRSLYLQPRVAKSAERLVSDLRSDVSAAVTSCRRQKHDTGTMYLSTLNRVQSARVGTLSTDERWSRDDVVRVSVNPLT